QNVLGPDHPDTNLGRRNLARLLLASGNATEALALAKMALSAHDKALGSGHARTKQSARVTADALDALGRGDEAAALRARYGIEQGSPGKERNDPALGTRRVPDAGLARARAAALRRPRTLACVRARVLHRCSAIA